MVENVLRLSTPLSRVEIGERGYAAAVRIRHVIPTVGPSAPAELVEAQDTTLRSIERALRCVDSDIEVDVRAVRFPDEPVDCDWITDCPMLDRSVLDMGEFDVQRRLPLLSDVLAGLGDSSEYDVAVFTNVDISVQPMFYELIAEIADEGHDAFSITRRTVQPRFRGSSLARLSATGGTVHPGHDCFVMTSEIVDRLEPCAVSLGVRWVARPLLWQLQLHAANFRNFGDLHATFHVGDDRAWVNPKLRDYEEYNEAEVKLLIEKLVARFGRGRVERLKSVEPFLRAIDTDAKVVTWPPRSNTVAYGSRAVASVQPRLIFSANSGRAGSSYLASLLDASARIDSEHERRPQMVGSWTRQVAYDARRVSYQGRLMKVDAIREEIQRLPAGWTYADTSHMFVKTFADVVFDEFQHERTSVVVLRRDPAETAKSFFELDFMGPRPRGWYDWFIPPTAPHSTFPIPPDEIEDQFDLIFGYLVDIENRTERLRELAPAVNWCDTTLDEIATIDGASALFDALGETVPTDLSRIISAKVNSREEPKSTIDQPVGLSFVRDRLAQFVERHAARRDLEAFVRVHGLEAG